MADEKEEVVESPDIHFEPIVSLPPVEIKTLEEDEDVIFKMRSKLFRYDAAAEPPEWKERGVGDIKILHHTKKNTCRVLMRRDKTLKICCNHFVSSLMELKPNCGSDRAWVWSTPCDYADEEAKAELLAVRFANAENAQKFKEAFQKSQKIVSENNDEAASTEESDSKEKSDKEEKEKKDEETESVADKLAEMSVKEETNKDSSKSDEKSSEEKKETNQTNKEQAES